MKSIPTILAVGLLATASSSAVPLTWDFGGTGGGRANDPSTIADFTAAGVVETLTGSLNLDSDVTVAAVYNLGTAPNNVTVNFYPANGSFTGASAPNWRWNGGLFTGTTQNPGSSPATFVPDTAVLNDYLYINENTARDVRIGNLKTAGILEAGKNYKLYIFSTGDGINQASEFTNFQVGTGTPSATVKRTAQTHPNTTTPANIAATRSVTFTFSTNADINLVEETLSFRWTEDTTDAAGGAGALNGFAIVEVPALGNLTSVDLVLTTNTVTEASNSPTTTATGTYEFGSADIQTAPGVVYASTNTSVATINSTGVITIVGPGSTDLSVSLNGKTDVETLNVEAITTVAQTIPNPIVLAGGPNITASATGASTSITGLAMNGRPNVTFTSSNTAVATIDPSTGVITRVGAGSTDISVTYKLVSSTPVSLTIEDPTSLTLTAPTTTLFTNGFPVDISVKASSTSLTDIAVDSFPGLSFSSTDDFIAQVDAITGLVTPYTAGVVTITAFLGPVQNTLDFTVGAEPVKPTALLHRYSFNENGGTTVTDSVGGKNGTIMDTGAVWNAGTLSLPGGNNNPANGTPTAAYVDLPNGLISTLPDNVTFELWATWDDTNANNANNRLFDFGTSSNGDGNSGNGTQWLFLTPRYNGGTNGITSRFTTSGVAGETAKLQAPTAASNGASATQVHYVITYDSAAQLATMIINGTKVGSAHAPSALSTLNDLNNWLGRSQWVFDNRIKATYDELRIYSGIMSESDAQASATAGVDAVFGPPAVLNANALSVANGPGAGQITLSWPDTVPSGTILEYSTTMAIGSWQPALDTPAESGGIRSVTITPPYLGAPKTFFRLKKAP